MTNLLVDTARKFCGRAFTEFRENFPLKLEEKNSFLLQTITMLCSKKGNLPGWTLFPLKDKFRRSDWNLKDLRLLCASENIHFRLHNNLGPINNANESKSFHVNMLIDTTYIPGNALYWQPNKDDRFFFKSITKWTWICGSMFGWKGGFAWQNKMRVY